MVKSMFKTLNLVFLCSLTYVFGDCNVSSNISDCRNPGRKLKECFCSCLEASTLTTDRNRLFIDYRSCYDHIRSCQNYMIGFIIKIFEELNIPLTEKEIWIKLNETRGIQDYNLEYIAGADLKLCKSYRLMIQPKCNLCDFCLHLKDINIKPEETCTQISTMESARPPEAPSPLNNAILVIALSICVIAVIGTIVVFIRRHHIQMQNYKLRNSRFPVINDIDDSQNGEHQSII